MKKELNIDLEKYFNWYSKLTNKSIDDIKNGEHAFIMFSDWLDIQSVELTKDIIGKEVYFSIDGEYKDTITRDVYLAGVVIRKGFVEEISDKKVKINGITYSFEESDSSGFFFHEKDLLLASLHYDGCDIYQINILEDCYNGNFVEDETL